MSYLLNCPHCGPRNVGEFRYGGQILPVPTGTPAPGADATRLASNLPEHQWERWFHRLGCQRWFAAERNVLTNEVLQTKEEVSGQ
jgi:heterotetrameric sarcosine oxidase delta subunit